MKKGLRLQCVVLDVYLEWMRCAVFGALRYIRY